MKENKEKGVTERLNEGIHSSTRKKKAAPNEKTDRRRDAIRASCENLVIIDLRIFLDIQVVQINGFVLPVGVLEGDNCGLNEF